jgi:hypothetical protein
MEIAGHISAHEIQTLMGGVILNGTSIELRAVVETGQILGPRVLAAGPGIFSSDGLEDKDAMAAFVKRYKDAYKTDTVKAYMSGDRLVRQWVILAARRYQLMPTTEGAPRHEAGSVAADRRIYRIRAQPANPAIV